MIGTIQCTPAAADHPYQLLPNIISDNNVETLEKTYKIPTGTNNDPINNAGIRISGVPTPPFLSASYLKTEEV